MKIVSLVELPLPSCPALVLKTWWGACIWDRRRS